MKLIRRALHDVVLHGPQPGPLIPTAGGRGTFSPVLRLFLEEGDLDEVDR